MSQNIDLQGLPQKNPLPCGRFPRFPPLSPVPPGRQGAIIGHHEVTEHVGDGHPCTALDDHQQHQGPEEDAQGGVDAFPEEFHVLQIQNPMVFIP